MKQDDEFYIGYLDGIGSKTKSKLRRFVFIVLGIAILVSIGFSISQNPFKNSTFELTSPTHIRGVFHENPYPMLRVEIAKNNYKNILLLGFGKSSVNPYLEDLLQAHQDLNGRTLSIIGNLIYYNGKTLIQITDAENIQLEPDSKQEAPIKTQINSLKLQGEIIDPKCYFGVMKPGKGKIHRSCAVRCISGGIPPVFASTDGNAISKYFLLTDMQRQPINKAVLPYIGKPAEIYGLIEKMEDWYIIKINPDSIQILSNNSKFY